MSLDSTRFAKEQIEILTNYVHTHGDDLDWQFIRRHTAELLAHTDEIIRHQEKCFANLVKCEQA